MRVDRVGAPSIPEPRSPLTPRTGRRSLRKKGLAKRRVETPEQRAKWEAWQRARQEEERQKELREMGYEVEEDDDETIGGDTRVW